MRGPRFVVVTLALVFAMAVPDPAATTALRTVAAVAAVLLAPGWLIVAGLGRLHRPRFELIVSSIGVSFATVIVLGLALNGMLRGLTTGSWILGLATACGSVALVCMMRWIGKPTEKPDRSRRPTHLGSASIAAMLLSVPVAVFALSLARDGAQAHREFAFTNLWILPDGDQRARRVTIGIANNEQTDQSYNLEVTSSGQIVLIAHDVRLADGSEFTRTISVPDDTSRSSLLEARLYMVEHPETVYRRVWLRLPHEKDGSDLARKARR